MPIRKNDIVVTLTDIDLGYHNLNVLPKGTRLSVHKAQRDGTLRCTQLDTKNFFTVTVHSNNVTKLNTPTPTVNIGDIYVCSWGYDQTNIDYYKVTAVKNKTVNLVSIGQKRNYTGTMQGECVPDPSVVGNKIYTKRMIDNGNGSASFKMTSFSWAYKWSGKSNHFTEWA